MEVETTELEEVQAELGAPKEWYESKTVWGSIVVIAAGAAGAFGYDIDAATQEEITRLIVNLVAIGGASVAVYGRVSAKTAIKPLK